MHIAVLNGKIIDVEFRAAREAEYDEIRVDDEGEPVVIDPGCTEVLQESHIEVIKVFLERDENAIEKNRENTDLNYYELLVDPENASLKKVV